MMGNMRPSSFPMETPFKPYDKECMRLAILQHEQIFKQQVYELHHLYRIQKILMKSIEGRSMKKNPSEDKSAKMEVNLEESNGDVSMIDETEIELSLGPTTFSSSATGPRHIKRTSYESTSFHVQVEEQQLRQDRKLKQKHPPWLFQVLT